MCDRNGRQERERGPRDMQALLNFCTNLTQADDTTQPSSSSSINTERREFLMNVLSNMGGNVGQKMMSCLFILNKEGSMHAEEQENALDELAEYCEDMNHAIDLHKIGGFPVIASCLSSPHSGVRSRAAGLVGNVCQNCEYCQTHMLELKILPMLLELLDNDHDDSAKIKALFAISCLIRDCKEGEERFLELDGLSYLMKALQTNIEKLIIKSCFLLSHLICQDVQCRESIISMGYIEQITNILSREETSDITREYCCRGLVELAQERPNVLKQHLPNELSLVTLLRSRLLKIKGNDELKDEDHLIRVIMASLPANETEDSINR